jgi:hypothetical protein
MANFLGIKTNTLSPLSESIRAPDTLSTTFMSIMAEYTMLFGTWSGTFLFNVPLKKIGLGLFS